MTAQRLAQSASGAPIGVAAPCPGPPQVRPFADQILPAVVEGAPGDGR